VVRCVSKNINQKDMRLKVTGLCAQYMLVILDFIVNMIGGGGGDLYDHFMSTGIVTMIMHKIFI